MSVKIVVEIEMNLSDVLMINDLARRLDMDFESTLRFLIRKGFRSLISPQAPNIDEETEKKEKKK